MVPSSNSRRSHVLKLGGDHEIMDLNRLPYAAPSIGTETQVIQYSVKITSHSLSVVFHGLAK